jgi:phytol kinase
VPAGSWWLEQLPGLLAVAGWLAALALLALAVRRRWPDQREWSRKVVHVGSGLVVPIAWACGIDRNLAVPAAGLVTLVAALNHRVQLLPAIEDVDRRSYGTVAYGASITLLLLLWWPVRPEVVTAGVLVMALGDGAAGLVGPALASPSWTVLGQRRTLAGTATMALTSLAVLIGLAALVQGGPAGAPTTGGLLLIAAAAVMLEQVALGGVDNLTVPLAVALLWSRLSTV